MVFLWHTSVDAIHFLRRVGWRNRMSKDEYAKMLAIDLCND